MYAQDVGPAGATTKLVRGKLIVLVECFSDLENRIPVDLQ